MTFARRIYHPPPSAPLRRLERPVVYAVPADVVVAVPKENPVRSESYRRLVAAMPCKACGWYQSQAAHLPPYGKGIKQDDRQTFALCIPHPNAQGDLVPGCHQDYDQYRLFPHDQAVKAGLQWAAETRQEIAQAGDWPAGLPRMCPPCTQDCNQGRTCPARQ